jgi:hypothetical protein
MNLGFIRDFIYAIKIPKALQEFFLEALRIAFVAAVSALLIFLTAQVATIPQEYQGIAIIALTAIGKSFDKYKFVINEENKVKGSNNFGLVGF